MNLTHEFTIHLILWFLGSVRIYLVSHTMFGFPFPIQSGSIMRPSGELRSSIDCQSNDQRDTRANSLFNVVRNRNFTHERARKVSRKSPGKLTDRRCENDCKNIYPNEINPHAHAGFKLNHWFRHGFFLRIFVCSGCKIPVHIWWSQFRI